MDKSPDPEVELTRALMRMGYRKLGEPEGAAVWGKPIACSILVFTCKDKHLARYIKSASDVTESLLWNSVEVHGETTEEWVEDIRYHETYLYDAHHGSQWARFDFLTTEETFAEWLNR